VRYVDYPENYVASVFISTKLDFNCNFLFDLLVDLSLLCVCVRVCFSSLLLNLSSTFITQSMHVSSFSVYKLTP
jgi:hypothetical protein